MINDNNVCRAGPYFAQVLHKYFAGESKVIKEVKFALGLLLQPHYLTKIDS